MRIRKYIKKPVTVEAVFLTKGNMEEIAEWIRSGGYEARIEGDHLIIQTLEGEQRASAGYYIVRGIKGEFYAVRKDIFETTYDILEVAQ